MLDEKNLTLYKVGWFCGRGGIGRRNRLKPRLSALGETQGAKLLKFGEPCNMAIPSQAITGNGNGRCRD